MASFTTMWASSDVYSKCYFIRHFLKNNIVVTVFESVHHRKCGVPPLCSEISTEQLAAIDESIRESIEGRVNKSEFDLLMRDIRHLLNKYEKVLEKTATPKNLKTLMKSLTDALSGSMPDLLKQNEKEGAVM